MKIHRKNVSEILNYVYDGYNENELYAVYRRNGASGVYSNHYLVTDWETEKESAELLAKQFRENNPEDNGWNAIIGVISYTEYARMR